MKSWFDFGDLVLFFKVSVGLKLPNLSQRCLCAQYLMNRLADFNQIYMDITFGHDKKLNRFWWPWSNFEGHCQTYSTKIKPKSVCLDAISWTIGWNVTKFATLYKLNRVNSLLDFGDLDLIFQVTASWLKLLPKAGLGGGGHLFSLKILLYLCFLLSLPMCFRCYGNLKFP